MSVPTKSWGSYPRTSFTLLWKEEGKTTSVVVGCVPTNRKYQRLERLPHPAAKKTIRKVMIILEFKGVQLSGGSQIDEGEQLSYCRQVLC